MSAISCFLWRRARFRALCVPKDSRSVNVTIMGVRRALVYVCGCLLVLLLAASQGAAESETEKDFIDDIYDYVGAAVCLPASGSCESCLAETAYLFQNGATGGACYYCPDNDLVPGIATGVCYYLNSYEDVFHSDKLHCDGLDFNVLTCSLTFKYLVIIVSLSVGIPVLLCVAACVGCCLCCAASSSRKRRSVVMTSSGGHGDKVPLTNVVEM